MRFVAARRTRRAHLLAAVVAALTGAAGCGSDAGPSRQTFVVQANRICADGNQAVKGLAGRIAAAQRGSDPDQVFNDLAALTRKATQAAQPFLDRLDAIQPPSADRDKLDSWVADQRRQQSLIADLADAFQQRRDAAISTLSQRIDALNVKNNAFARRYGMDQCAQNVT